MTPTKILTAHEPVAVVSLSEDIRKFFADGRKFEQFARAKAAQRLGSLMLVNDGQGSTHQSPRATHTK